MAALVLRVAPNIPGAASVFRSQKTRGYDRAKAFLVQVSASSGNKVYRFPFAPVETTYENLSSEYEEIRRPVDYSYISRRGPQLARVSFEFRVSHRPSQGWIPIVGDLELLRTIALEDSPVALVGMGDFLFGADAQFNARQTGQRTQSLYRIMEMGITVVRRSPDTNEPTQADCRITLIEDRNPVFNIVALPKIEYEAEPPTEVASTKSGGNGGKGKSKSTPAPKTTNKPKKPISEIDTNHPVIIPGKGAFT